MFLNKFVNTYVIDFIFYLRLYIMDLVYYDVITI